MRIEERLEALGLHLPPAMQPPPGVVLPFSPVRIVRDRALISGHGPQNPDGTFAGPYGKVDADVSVEDAY
ncbi:MAG: RidA family protein, partial [Candidatus Limnocylindrales bacterium]